MNSKNKVFFLVSSPGSTDLIQLCMVLILTSFNFSGTISLADPGEH